jgi:type 1 glutamine amidotransferase
MKKEYWSLKQVTLTVVFALLFVSLGAQEKKLKVLNFYADNGFVHDSQKAGLEMIESLGTKNGWEVVTTNEISSLSLINILTFDVVLFNNNCGNNGPILSQTQEQAMQQFIRNGGGFVGIHCAGALWHEDTDFQKWYEGLIGTKLVDHPKVQKATLIVEDTSHESTAHLPKEWILKEEFHRFSENPRDHVNVLISVDEDSYKGKQKMGGDHPITWYQHYDGGRSFFTSLGHTKEIYADANYQEMVTQGIVWAAGSSVKNKTLPVTTGLVLDLDADYGISVEDGAKIYSWENKVQNNPAKYFVKRDEGREVPGSGRPRLALNQPKINGHNTVVFHEQELVCHDEDFFDKLTKGSGYTWLSVMAIYEQQERVSGVNSFFGNLRNTNIDGKGLYEGFWGGLTDDNLYWMGSRNSITHGRWDENNPYVLAPTPVEELKYYLIMGRMDAGTDTVNCELFVNDLVPVAVEPYPVTSGKKVNPSKMCIGQERDAINHPGGESFDGEITRFLIFDRPLSAEELSEVQQHLIQKYAIELE